jgi:hypothetical protein
VRKLVGEARRNNMIGPEEAASLTDVPNMVIFAQRLEKVKLAGSVALGGVGHPRFTVSAAPCTECLGSPMGLLVNSAIN